MASTARVHELARVAVTGNAGGLLGGRAASTADAPPVPVLKGEALAGGRLVVRAVGVGNDGENVRFDLVDIGIARGAESFPCGVWNYGHTRSSAVGRFASAARLIARAQSMAS